MLYKMKFNHTVPVNEYPEDFEMECSDRDDAFCEMLNYLIVVNDFPIDDVLEDGNSVLDDWEDFYEAHLDFL